MRSRIQASAIRARILADAPRVAATESARIARTTLSFYDVTAPDFSEVYTATWRAVYRAVYVCQVGQSSVDLILLATSVAKESQARLRWRRSAGSGRTAVVLHKAMRVLPERDRIRWLDEWEAELISIRDLRAKRRFVRQTLVGIPRLAFVLRRPLRVRA